MASQTLSTPKRVVLEALETAGIAPMVLDARDRARYRLDRETQGRNAAFTAPDGLPLPPPHLVHKVVGHFDQELFYEGGVTRFAHIRGVLEDNGVAVDGLGDVLDWGCGCGRVLRRWRDVEGVQIHGSDYNFKLVEWCRGAFPFARLATNGLAPPLAFPDDSFDLLYAISVFTHLDEPLQVPWMQELRRVVRPGGHILVTTNGVVASRALEGEERARYERGELVVEGGEFQGRNFCAVVHSEEYVRNILAGDLELLAAIPAERPEYDHGQDSYLLRVPS